MRSKKPFQSPFDKQSAASALVEEHLATLVTNTEQFKNRDKSYRAFTKVDANLSLEL